MAEHNELGRTGEDEACFYLLHAGYEILDRNWRAGHLEIDIVANLLGEIVFIEVKSRRDNRFDQARKAVTLSKKHKLVAAAHAYMAKHRLEELPYRYDIITVVGTQRPYCVTHFPFAYTEEGVRYHSRHRREEFEV